MKPKMHDLQLARQIKKELQQKLGNNLIRVVFYGSRAEGKARNESDLDLFLLVKNKPKIKSLQDEAILDIVLKYLDDDFYVSPVVYDLKTFKQNSNLSFVKEVKRGVKL